MNEVCLYTFETYLRREVFMESIRDLMTMSSSPAKQGQLAPVSPVHSAGPELKIWVVINIFDMFRNILTRDAISTDDDRAGMLSR